jgi:hypothetical protein
MLALFMFALGSVTSAGAGQPETPPPPSENQPDVNGVPEPRPPSEHKGVIEPPDIGDEGIHTDVPDPDAGHEEEVIPPSEIPEQPPESEAR